MAQAAVPSVNLAIIDLILAFVMAIYPFEQHRVPFPHAMGILVLVAFLVGEESPDGLQSIVGSNVSFLYQFASRMKTHAPLITMSEVRSTVNNSKSRWFAVEQSEVPQPLTRSVTQILHSRKQHYEFIADWIFLDEATIKQVVDSNEDLQHKVEALKSQLLQIRTADRVAAAAAERDAAVRVAAVRVAAAAAAIPRRTETETTRAPSATIPTAPLPVPLSPQQNGPLPSAPSPSDPPPPRRERKRRRKYQPAPKGQCRADYVVTDWSFLRLQMNHALAKPACKKCSRPYTLRQHITHGAVGFMSAFCEPCGHEAPWSFRSSQLAVQDMGYGSTRRKTRKRNAQAVGAEGGAESESEGDSNDSEYNDADASGDNEQEDDGAGEPRPAKRSRTNGMFDVTMKLAAGANFSGIGQVGIDKLFGNSGIACSDIRTTRVHWNYQEKPIAEMAEKARTKHINEIDAAIKQFVLDMGFGPESGMYIPCENAPDEKISRVNGAFDGAGTHRIYGNFHKAVMAMSLFKVCSPYLKKYFAPMPVSFIQHCTSCSICVRDHREHLAQHAAAQVEEANDSDFLPDETDESNGTQSSEDSDSSDSADSWSSKDLHNADEHVSTDVNDVTLVPVAGDTHVSATAGSSAAAPRIPMEGRDPNTPTLVLNKERLLYTNRYGTTHYCPMNTTHTTATSESATAFEVGYQLLKKNPNRPPLLVDYLSTDADASVIKQFKLGQMAALKDKWGFTDEQIKQLDANGMLPKKSSDLAHVNKNFNKTIALSFGNAPKSSKKDPGNKYPWSKQHMSIFTGIVRKAAADGVRATRASQRQGGPNWLDSCEDEIYRIESEFFRRTRWLPFHLMNDHRQCHREVCTLKSGEESQEQYLAKVREKNAGWVTEHFEEDGTVDVLASFDFVSRTQKNIEFAEQLQSSIKFYYRRISTKATGPGTNSVEWAWNSHSSLAGAKRILYRASRHSVWMDEVMLNDLVGESVWKPAIFTKFGMRSSARALDYFKRREETKRKKKEKPQKSYANTRAIQTQVRAWRATDDPTLQSTQVSGAFKYGHSLPVGASTIQKRITAKAKQRTSQKTMCLSCHKKHFVGVDCWAV